MKLRCVGCGLVQPNPTTRKPADKIMAIEERITVCVRCGGMYGDYVVNEAKGVVLGDGRTYLRVRDLEPNDKLLDKVIKHMSSPATWYAPLRDDPDMLIARL